MLWAGKTIAIFYSCIALPLQAADPLSVEVTTGKSVAYYDDSPYRDYLDASNFNIDTKIANKWGISVGFEHTLIHYKLGIPDYQQNSVFISYRSSNVPSHQLDALALNYLPRRQPSKPGRYTTRLDFYCVADRDYKNSADNTCIFAPQVSYMRLDRTEYADLGYAIAHYGVDPQRTDPLRVEQWTPTLGMATNDLNTHWLQIRGYIIHYSNRLRTQLKDKTKAVEAKYLYYPLSVYKIVPRYIETSIVVGERMYSVDRDSNSVNNLADLEKTAVALAAQWLLTPSLALTLNLSRKQYYEQNAYIRNNYSITTSWLGVTVKW